MSSSTIDYNAIKSNVRIGEVLRRYGYPVPYRDSYRIPCMLHGGIGFNLSVTEHQNLYHCFTCGASGSVIDLVAALEKVDVKEAASKLATDFNLSQPLASVAVARGFQNQVERYKKMKEENKIELPPHRQLEEGYRELTRQTIKHWQLGRTNEGVLIPLIGKDGSPCSYSVRRDDGNPKYENAKGMSKCWPFGLFQNQHEIVHEGFAYLVEGQLDAVMMWQHGYRNVVAIMGSQISEQQAMLLLVLTSTLMLVMDGDAPGKKATDEITKRWGSIFKVGRVDLPDGLDPDEYLLKGGKLGVLET